MRDGRVTAFLALEFARRQVAGGPARCLQRFSTGGKITTHRCDAWGKTAGLGCVIRLHERRKSWSREGMFRQYTADDPSYTVRLCCTLKPTFSLAQ